MRELGLTARRPSHRTITTKSEKGARVAENLLQRDFGVNQLNCKWVSDTTYIWTTEGWLYLAVVLDLFARLVVGWSMAAVQDAALVEQALQMALARRRPQAGLLHHSDRGSTYTAESYQAILTREGIQVSMSRTGNCYDNAAMESFASLASKMNALTASTFRHGHRLDKPPLNILSASTIGSGGTPP